MPGSSEMMSQAGSEIYRMRRVCRSIMVAAAFGKTDERSDLWSRLPWRNSSHNVTQKQIAYVAQLQRAEDEAGRCRQLMMRRRTVSASRQRACRDNA